MTEEEQKQEKTETKIESVKTVEEVLTEKYKDAVTREEYNKAIEENAKLAKMIIDGTGKPASTEAQPEESIDDIRKVLFGNEPITNMEYVSNALKLRKKVLEENGEDIFVPSGHQITASQEDYERAQAVADVFQECIDIADGDAGVFQRELDRRTVDINIPTRRGH